MLQPDQPASRNLPIYHWAEVRNCVAERCVDTSMGQELESERIRNASPLSQVGLRSGKPITENESSF